MSLALDCFMAEFYATYKEIIPGSGRGEWGEGFSGTTIKDTWTKSMGRVEAGDGGGFGWGGVEGWGENADN